MTIPIAIQKVQLPEGFQAVSSADNGDLLFSFNPPIKLPYDAASMAEFRKQEAAKFEARKRRDDWRNGNRYIYEPEYPRYKTSDITNLIFAVVKAALPEFIGDNYKKDMANSEEREPWVASTPTILLLEAEGMGLETLLAVEVHSKQDFMPHVDNGNSTPTIDSGAIKGIVYLDTKIPFPKVGQIYVPEFAVAILQALTASEQLEIGESMTYHTSINNDVYVQVENPTTTRMQAARKEAAEVSRHFHHNISPITEAAAIFGEAHQLHHTYKIPVLNAYEGLSNMIAVAATGLDVKLMTPGIEEAMAKIDAPINAKLAEATEKIRPLYAGFPRDILQYAAKVDNDRPPTGKWFACSF